MSRAIATPFDEANTLTNLAGAYEALGLDFEALGAFQTALQTAETSASLRLQASILSTIGLVYHRLDRLDAALEIYQRGLEMAQALPTPALESQLLDQLGGTLQRPRRDRPGPVELSAGAGFGQCHR
ncbi:MAG: tetratricopeptide repeat protein [Cyanobacteria bacterium P01_D01_bin.14]